MSLPLVDVYDFLRLHEKMNNFRYKDELLEYIKKNDISFYSNEWDGRKKIEHSRQNLYNITNLKDYKGFCNNKEDNMDAIVSIREAIIVIDEALKDIEKKRICEGIRDITKGVKHTEKGLTQITQIVNEMFK